MRLPDQLNPVGRNSKGVSDRSGGLQASSLCTMGCTAAAAACSAACAATGIGIPVCAAGCIAAQSACMFYCATHGG